MKIVAGQFGGRKLHSPNDHNIRPTSSKVRGAIFNSLNSRGALQDAVVLDCFCGTGALGLEAISRGASHVTFIDKSKKSLSLAKENSKMLNVENQVDFILKDATKNLNFTTSHNYNLVFLDPPYGAELITNTLNNLHGIKCLEVNAITVIEAEKNIDTILPVYYTKLDQKYYKDTQIITAQYKG